MRRALLVAGLALLAACNIQPKHYTVYTRSEKVCFDAPSYCYSTDSCVHCNVYDEKYALLGEHAFCGDVTLSIELGPRCPRQPAEAR